MLPPTKVEPSHTGRCPLDFEGRGRAGIPKTGGEAGRAERVLLVFMPPLGRSVESCCYPGARCFRCTLPMKAKSSTSALRVSNLRFAGAAGRIVRIPGTSMPPAKPKFIRGDQNYYRYLNDNGKRETRCLDACCTIHRALTRSR